MPIVAAVAGPSRLPFNAITQSVKRSCSLCPARRHASTASANSTESDADADGDEAGRLARQGYRDWLQTSGRQYEKVRKGQQAIWLGGSIPFPGNPSFRPPAPLSNDMQNVLYERLRAGSTPAQLSHRYNISKARIEAVKKLKDVEREFTRQRLPTQDAFQSGMESLLNVRSPLDPKSKTADSGRERDEATSRAMHPSSAIELAEEDRWNAGIGRGGAFGNRSTQVEQEGLELTAWEFRDEAAEVEEKKAAAKQARSVTDAVKPVAVEMASAEAGSDTPEAHRIAEALANPPSQDTSDRSMAPSVKAGKYAFVDVSGKSRWKQEKKPKRGQAKP